MYFQIVCVAACALLPASSVAGTAAESAVTVIGPFSHMNSDAVLKAIGVENASAGVCREPEKPQSPGARVRIKPGVYALLARWATTEEHPAAPGFHFRLDDSSDVATERKVWQESLRRCKPELERIANYATRPAAVEKAKKLLAAIEK
jgi:hypothetical protein